MLDYYHNGDDSLFMRIPEIEMNIDEKKWIVLDFRSYSHISDKYLILYRMQRLYCDRNGTHFGMQRSDCCSGQAEHLITQLLKSITLSKVYLQQHESWLVGCVSYELQSFLIDKYIFVCRHEKQEQLF